MIPVLPNGTTLVTEYVLKVAGLIEAQVAGKPDAPSGRVFLPSFVWGLLMRELRAKVGIVLPEQEAFFQQNEFLVGRVTFCNAHTDDEKAVLLANQMYAEQTGFSWKAENLQSGRSA